MATALCLTIGPPLILFLNWAMEWLANATPKEDLLSRRPSDPQRGAANGTGVEDRVHVGAAVLPRSPMTPGADDPRPSAPGLDFPAGVATPAEARYPGALPPSAALAGFQTPTGAVTLRPTAPVGPQPPVGAAVILSAPAGARRRVMFHG